MRPRITATRNMLAYVLYLEPEIITQGTVPTGAVATGEIASLLNPCCAAGNSVALTPHSLHVPRHPVTL